MRNTPNLMVERYRVKTGPRATNRWDGNNGAFFIPLAPEWHALVIVSDHLGWEHVSVTIKATVRGHIVEAKRCPTWEEMDRIKRLFWNDDETVMQLHVPRSNHISVHDYCLHLWRPLRSDIPTPPAFMVGGVSADEAVEQAREYAASIGETFP